MAKGRYILHLALVGTCFVAGVLAGVAAVFEKPGRVEVAVWFFGLLILLPGAFLYALLALMKAKLAAQVLLRICLWWVLFLLLCWPALRIGAVVGEWRFVWFKHQAERTIVKRIEQFRREHHRYPEDRQELVASDPNLSLPPFADGINWYYRKWAYSNSYELMLFGPETQVYDPCIGEWVHD